MSSSESEIYHAVTQRVDQFLIIFVCYKGKLSCLNTSVPLSVRLSFRQFVRPPYSKNNSKSRYEGARSHYFWPFQHWLNGRRINLNMKIMVQNYRRTQTKQRKAKKGHGWTKLGRIEMDCIRVNLKNVGPLFFKLMSVYIKMSFIVQLENNSQLLCGLDFANERLLLCQFDF